MKKPRLSHAGPARPRATQALNTGHPYANPLVYRLMHPYMRILLN